VTLYFSINQLYNHKSLKLIWIRIIKEVIKKQWDKKWNENIKIIKIL